LKQALRDPDEEYFAWREARKLAATCPQVITAKLLDDLGACDDGFTQLWPDGEAKLTIQNLRRAARHGLQWQWILHDLNGHCIDGSTWDPWPVEAYQDVEIAWSYIKERRRAIRAAATKRATAEG
jgi:TPP-dependent 2-oxoacid decarboxylase